MIIEDCRFERILGIPVNIYRGGSDESTAGPYVTIKGCVFDDCCNKVRGSVIRITGAQVLSVITNDAWWGDTPGYRQHCSYASLRAIETRRDIARCANTGISCIINQRGDIVEKTSWWEPAVICGEVNLNTRETFFVRTGDFVGRICVLVFFLLLLWLVSRSFIPKSLR